MGNMGFLGYNYTSSNHIKATAKVLVTLSPPFAKPVKEVRTILYSTPVFPQDLENYAPWVVAHGLLAPYGECQCGCGGMASIARSSDATRGFTRNHPCRYIRHHHNTQERVILGDIVPPSGCELIPLTQGKVAIIDAVDYEWLSKWRWAAYLHSGRWYAARNERLPNDKFHSVYMHKILTDFDSGMLVDHKDGNSLNNTRDNLRPATPSQNQYNRPAPSSNTCGYKGVYFDKRLRKWVAQIAANKQRTLLGYFDTAQEAARAYDEAAKKYHGEFAWLNFPEEVK